MNEEEFESSALLEKLASLGLVDEFFEAVDSDDVVRIVSLLEDAGLDEESIEALLKEIEK